MRDDGRDDEKPLFYFASRFGEKGRCFFLFFFSLVPALIMNEGLFNDQSE